MVVLLRLESSWGMFFKGTNSTRLIKDEFTQKTYILPLFEELVKLATRTDLENQLEVVEDTLIACSIDDILDERQIPYFNYVIGSVVNELITDFMLHNIQSVKRVLEVTLNNITVEV